MLCDICHKNEATIHVTEIVNDQVQEIHVCEECAIKKGIIANKKFGLADFLAELTDFDFPELEEVAKETTFRCSNCGLTFDDFRRIGRLGCSQCYETFKKGLAPLLKKIHGSLQHVGKIPEIKGMKASISRQIEQLQRQLNEAIEKEEFERAAELRDKIKELKSKRSKK
ncbi:MAG TPA: hypothetical protein ENG55_00165 [Candidatus Omnitrophica bacterium]|nr:hypothetical protein [Candidatus Omnitrophota bacterium]